MLAGSAGITAYIDGIIVVGLNPEELFQCLNGALGRLRADKYEF